MVQSKAKTVAQYLRELEENRRKAISKVRAVIRKHLPKGYVESMNWGMIAYEVPLKTFPETYNKQPLLYCALAAQKQYNALYLQNVYGSKRMEKKLADGFKKAGKKLNMGKSCVRFQDAEDLPLDLIGEIVGATDLDAFLEMYQKSRKKK